MYKKRKKKRKTLQLNTVYNILQQLIYQNYRGLYIRLRHWGMIWWSISANCMLAHTGGVWGGCALSEAENFVFLKLKSCNMEYKCKFRSGDEQKKKNNNKRKTNKKQKQKQKKNKQTKQNKKKKKKRKKHAKNT